jgi:GNAT superfamily N-acetyltransferase
MITTIRTDSAHPDFIPLVKLLDAELAILDGAEHAFYSQFNTINNIKNVVVAYENKIPVACGAIKEFDRNTAEIKRMYTTSGNRGKGIAAKVLSELEAWAKEQGYNRCILETGHKQPEAIALYRKCGYSITPNYGQYAGVENSVCFEKTIHG